MKKQYEIILKVVSNNIGDRNELVDPLLNEWRATIFTGKNFHKKYDVGDLIKITLISEDIVIPAWKIAYSKEVKDGNLYTRFQAYSNAFNLFGRGHIASLSLFSFSVSDSQIISLFSHEKVG